MAHPNFARFHKCDLQLQTPADARHWEGSVKLTAQTAPGVFAAQVTAFVDACYDADLDVIGITDHNLGGGTGLRFLEAACNEIEKQAGGRGRRITVFPGFEIKAQHVGGVHFLCLFDPGRAASEVSDVLTGLGLPPNRRANDQKANCILDELLEKIEKAEGIVIAAHADAAKGALDDKALAEAWQHDVIANPRLLAIELTKPRPEFDHLQNKLGQIVRNELGPFHRPHPIAVVNSSDNKRLGPDDGNSLANFIGSRHTWIKMSKPSVEGLRQAFLDHESRIAFGPARPEDMATHPRIERVAIRGARFLADQELRLSPNLNALIGGGGTGKSTILEYVRATMGQPARSSDDVLKNHQQALASLGAGEVTITVRQGDNAFDLVYPAEEDPFGSIEARFPIVALSQREVFAVASSPQATLDLIDRLQHDRMDGLRRAEQRAAQQLAELDLELSKLVGLRRDEQRLAAELIRETATLAAVEKRQEPLAILNQHRREQEAVASIDQAVLAVARRIASSADELALGVGRSRFRDPDTPHADALDAFLQRMQDAVGRAAAEVQRVAAQLTAVQEAEAAAQERATWLAQLALAQQQYGVLLAEAPEPAGADPMRRMIAALQIEHAEVQQSIAALEARGSQRVAREKALRSVWEQQVRARENMADRLKELGPKTEAGSRYVEVTIHPFDDIEPLCQKMEGWMDLRSVASDAIRRLCEAAQKTFDGAARVAGLVGWIDAMEAGDHIPELEALGLGKKKKHDAIVRAVDENKRRELRRLRLPDRAEVLLRRSDGTTAGTLEKGLSVGQRCTAILALALSAGTDPILIDQPEDEIDNEFIYTELVPLLRSAKRSRQILISTHNPNLPVNGDAELIYALVARSDGGDVRGQLLVEGSLDSQNVKDAVGQIMEGSREAFERRKARYGF